MYAYPELLETQNYFSDNQNENFNTSFENETIKTIYQEPAPVRDYAPIEIMPPNKIQLNETKGGSIFDAVKILNDEKSLYIFDEDIHQSYYDKKPWMKE